jgi:DNA-binding helix-hairpin-helix protein with protein kinase domain
MHLQVFSRTKEPALLTAPVGKGGEATVYTLNDRADVLVKVYHDTVLRKRGTLLQEKVEAMMGLPVNAPLSWPRMSVFDADGQWVGYAMRRAEGVIMPMMMNPVLVKRYFPGMDRMQIVTYLLAYLKALQAIHQQGILVGDYNPQNVLCQPGTSRVTLIDCDSFQIEARGKSYPCPVMTADMSPIEHHGLDSANIRRTLQSERFSMAIILFKALMLGRHPYDIVGGADPVSNMRSGQFAYGKGNTGIPKGPWYNIWSHMPYRLKNLFIGTFTEGARNPDARPTVEQWTEALKIYQIEIEKGWHNREIAPAQPKSDHYRGRQSVEQVSVSQEYIPGPSGNQ